MIFSVERDGGHMAQLIGDSLYQCAEVIRVLNRLSGSVGVFGNATVRIVFCPGSRTSQRIDDRVEIIRTVGLVRKLRRGLHRIGDRHQIASPVVNIADGFA